MRELAAPIERLVATLSKLPGIGQKTAFRLAMHIINASESYAVQLSDSIRRIQKEIHFCNTCFALTDIDPCRLCQRADRDDSLLCVVESPQDLLAIENSNQFRGRYHVLHGIISPLEGVGPDRLRIKELLDRLKHADEAQEVLIATNSSVEGEATALYLAKLIRPLDIKVSRLASGVPMGGLLEFVDKMTLAKAIEGRRDIY